MAKRYSVREKSVLGGATRGTTSGGGAVRRTVYVVHDSKTGLVARGTKGAGGAPAGYASKGEARAVAADLNKAEEKRQKQRRDRS